MRAPFGRWRLQRCFLGLGLRAIQEGDDPDRYVPDTSAMVVTLVGSYFGGSRLFELDLDDELTVAEAVEAVSKEWRCNPSNTKPLATMEGHSMTQLVD